MQIFWEYIKRYSDISEVGDGGHLAIEIFEFPKSGWKNPHAESKCLVMNPDFSKQDSTIPRSDFELCCSTFGSSDS
jgi:hypothetical protein